METNLGAVVLEELGRIHAIDDGAADEGEPVEDHGGFVGVREEELVRDIEEDREEDKGTEANGDLGAESQSLELLGERVARELLEEAHREKAAGGCFVGGGGDLAASWRAIFGEEQRQCGKERESR